ncbi:CRTAC1 family protein [Mariprofundus sp. NF]|uniref:CRTAC1 family protein n=1 Tax=Mariprofundus sp. NF TaxID=2608716 RepID=UPI0015A3C3A8|nr:CRTAC1 family protein [Mariprofundus sp. NF]
MRILKRLLLTVVALVILIMAMLTGKSMMDRQDDYDVDLTGVEVPTFTASAIAFNQGNDFTVSLPFLASAIIDIDGDGIEELFLGGGQNNPDGLFKFKNNQLVAIEGAAGLTKGNAASYGSVVLDVNGDGSQDLLVARQDGIWLHQNNQGSFTSTKLNAAMPDGTVPLSIAIADLNRDGAFDMYVAGYIRHDLVEGQNLFREGYGGSSRLFINNGDNTFTDMTDQAGLTYKHNTFQSAFIDIDRDGKEDLIVAHDTGHVVTWRNLGGMKFERVSNPNTNEFSYPMGLGITDLGNDGLVDFFFSNVGSTPPNFMIRGDLTDEQVSNWKWMLFQNRGGFKFEDVAAKVKIADYEFSWGGVFEDLNLDGMEDLLVSENYIGLPPHKVPFLRLNGRLLLQKANGEFAPAEKEAGVINQTYSISPLTADFNGDGRPDIVHANLNGDSKLFLSHAGKGNYLKVELPHTVGSIGATVTVKLTDGRTLSRPYVSGEGLCSDSSRIIIFGLRDEKVSEINVSYLNGKVVSKNGSFDNTLVRF